MKKRISHFKWLAAAVVGLLTVPAAFMPIAVNALKPPVSDSRELDTSKLQDCMAVTGASLDVLVLMDASSSMIDGPEEGDNDPVNDPGSDVHGKRGEIVISAIESITQMVGEIGDDHNVWVNLTSFGKKGQNLPSMDWTKISPTDPRGSLGDDFNSKATNAKGKGTDWTDGITRAIAEFDAREKRAKGPSCPVLLWITDGVIRPDGNPENTKLIRESLDQLCKPGGEMDNLRTSGVVVLGGLLEPKGDEQELSKIFRVVVEGKAPLPEDQSYFGGSLDGYLCGTPKIAGSGKVVIAKDPSELAWKFVGLTAGLQNLVDLKPAGKGFYVDPNTGLVQFYLKSDQEHSNPEWTLKDAGGKEICSSGNLRKYCNVDDKLIKRVVVDVPATGISYGDWSVETEADELAAFGRLQGKLTGPKLVIKTGVDWVEGESHHVTAELQNKNGSEFSQEGYESIQICLKISGNEVKPTCSPGVQAGANLKAMLGDKSVMAIATLKTSHQPERKYVLNVSADINVSRVTELAYVKCSGPDSPCKFGDLPNNKQPSKTTLIVVFEEGVVGKTTTLSNFEILNTNDSLFRRSSEYKVKVLVDGQEKESVTLEEGKTAVEFEVQIWNDSNEWDVGNLEGELSYTAKAGEKSATRTVQFSLEIQNTVDSFKTALLVILVYLLSLLLPYAWLMYSARKNAVLNVPDEELAWATLPITLSKEGVLTNRVADDVEVNPVLTPPELNQLVMLEVPEKSRSVQIGDAGIQVIPPKLNPFQSALTQFSLPGNILLSSGGRLSHQLVNDATSVEPTLHENFVVAFPIDVNIQPREVSSEVVDESSNDDPWKTEEVTRTQKELKPVEGSITGIVYLLIPAYGNRRKALAKITSEVAATIAWTEIAREFDELRKSTCEAEVARREAAEAAALKKAPKVIETVRTVVEEKDKNPIGESVEEENVWDSPTTDAFSDGVQDPFGNLDSWHDSSDFDDPFDR